MSVKTSLCAVLLAAFLCVGVRAEDAPALSAADAKASLEGAGFKVGTTGISLPDEAEFAKQMKDLQNLRKTLITTEKELATTEGQHEQLKAFITNLKAEHVKLSSAMAAGGLDFNTESRLIGALNATPGKISLSIEQQEKSNEAVKAARGKSNEARGKYVEQILSMRTLADKVSLAWETAAADPKQQAALVKVNEVLNKKLALKPSVSFGTAERQLQSLEDKILSESIKITTEGGTPWVAVTINGKHTKQMVVDSGSSSLLLPFAMAKEMGLEPNSTDPEVTCVLADGSEVTGHMKKLAKVRVGKFEVEDVECVVLEARAFKAQALLGMSYLEHFKFEVDTNRDELKMVKVDVELGGKKKAEKPMEKSEK